MAEIKNAQYSQLDKISRKSKNPIKETALSEGEGEGCMKKVQRKFESCTDVLANYFQCVRVFSNEKLQQLRRKAQEEERELEELGKENKSQISLDQTQKYSQLQKHPEYKTFTKKEKNLLIEDLDQLPVQDYSTNKKLRFNKRYAETYDRSYSERRKKFGYTFQEVELDRERQYSRKEKNFWSEFKRLICCRGGNYIEELEERERETEAENSSIYSQKRTAKKEPSLASNNRREDNIFLFEQTNEMKEEPQEVHLSKHGHKINRNVKVVNKEEQNSSRKTQDLEHRNQSQSEARKISTRLGVDTQLLIKRKQYEEKTNNEYDYKQSLNKNLEQEAERTRNQQVDNSPKKQSSGYGNINTATNSQRTQPDKMGDQANGDRKNSNISDTQRVNKNSWDASSSDFPVEDTNYQHHNNGSTNERATGGYGHENQSNNGYGGSGVEGGRQRTQQNVNRVDESDEGNRRYQDGVAKVKVDKKAKISKMMKQVQNQNDEQFNNSQVIFYSDDMKEKGDQSNHSNLNPNFYNQDRRLTNDDARQNEHHNSMDMSLVSQDSANYQRVKKSKNKSKIKNAFNTSNHENAAEQEQIEYVQNNETSQSQVQEQIRDSMAQGEKAKKNTTSNRLIIKQNDEQNLNHTIDYIPSTKNEQSESVTFKKKRKAKKNIHFDAPQEDNNDDVIVIDELDMENTKVHREQGVTEQEAPELKPAPQQMKKKKNKRNNLIVDQGNNQQAIDLEDL